MQDLHMKRRIYDLLQMKAMTHITFTCSKSAIETIKKKCEICSKSTIKTLERRH